MILAKEVIERDASLLRRSWGSMTLTWILRPHSNHSLQSMNLYVGLRRDSLFQAYRQQSAAFRQRRRGGGGELNRTREKRGGTLFLLQSPPVFFFFFRGGSSSIFRSRSDMTAGTGPEARCRGKQTERVSIPLKSPRAPKKGMSW